MDETALRAYLTPRVEAVNNALSNGDPHAASAIIQTIKDDGHPDIAQDVLAEFTHALLRTRTTKES